jgi:hypothetical protein
MDQHGTLALALALALAAATTRRARTSSDAMLAER